MKLNVLSLFDGISCGRVALERAGTIIDKYYTSEIDKYASAISRYHYPDNIELGDVTEWRTWSIDWSSIDLLLAGFPCQAWSVAGKQGGVKDPRGKLVYCLLEIWGQIKLHNPDIKVLFENVQMKSEHMIFINDIFEMQPVFINSALVSAQNRKRYYWTNIWNVTQPEDKHIYLKDIVHENTWSDREKSYCIDANYHKGINEERYRRKSLRQIVYKQIGGGYRLLTPIECCRLQTLSDDYTRHGIMNGKLIEISNTQQYKALGNGWTVDVISHILSGLKLENVIYKDQGMLF